MEVAKIDWEDSKFEKDDIYEHINAPQWIDFSVPNHDPQHDDDVAWFCRPDCNHPKTVEDFLKQQTHHSKLLRSASVSEVLPLGDRNRRDVALKKRGIPQPTIWSGIDLNGNRYAEDSENQNPNMSTPPYHKSRLMKESIKSSAEKKLVDIPLHKEETTPRLKSTLSARNLFAGKDILNQITEFCTALKRLASRDKEREDGEKENTEKSPVAAARKQEAKECSDDNNSGVLQERANERKPLLEARKEKIEVTEKSGAKEKLRRKKRNDEAENTPPVSVNLKSIRRKEEESLLQIRTNPPSPQCFSANRAPIKATPPKAFRPRPPERNEFQQLEESNNEEVKKDEPVGRGGANRKIASAVAEREARTLDVLWFLKPCTLSS